jgi:integrase
MQAGGGVTLAAYAERWVRRRRVRGRPLRLRTVVGYESLLRLYLLPALGQVPIAHLTRGQVRAWYDDLAEAKGAGVAAESYALLRAICVTAVEDELLRTTPCSLRGAGKRWSPERPVLTVEQLLALAAAVAPHFRAVVLLGGFCCLRMGELAALQRSAVDLQTATVAVRASAGYISGHGYVLGDSASRKASRAGAW